MCKGGSIANVWMDCMNPQTVEEYFEMLKAVMAKRNFFSNPSQMYNVDETDMLLDHIPPKVMAKRGQTKVHCRTSGNKSQITVIACVSATGHTIPP